MRGIRGRSAVVFYAILQGCLQASAQTCAPGELRVTVKDSQEAPIYDAKVGVAPTGASHATPATGLAEFPELSCGSYTVSIAKEGFEESSRPVQITGPGLIEISVILLPQTKRSSVDVTDTPPPVEQSSSQNYQLHPAEVKTLPTNPGTVAEALPLVPGVVRAPSGDLILDGSGEERSSLVVNQTDVTDPATGRFGQTVPVDSIQSVNVLNTPFLAQYGRFTQSVVAVETRRGGDKWHADLNDPFPDFRIRSYHMRGIKNETPRGVLGGPILRDRLFVISSLLYYLDKVQSRTLPFPFNVSKQERVNSFTQVDYIASQRQIVNATFHFSPEHTNFVNPDFFTPESVSPSYAQRNYVATVADHLGLLGGTLDTSLSYQRFHTFVGSQGDAAMVLTPEGATGNYFGVQSRDAFRREWLEIWSPSPLQLAGVHQLKIGSSLTISNDRGQFTFRPVEIVDTAGTPLERIDFANTAPYKRTDLEYTLYGQDHWVVSPGFAFDYGLRVEHQRLAESLRIAPRAGLAWTPFSDGRTVFRAGYGQFYDHIPLDVYAFSRYPNRTITDYATGTVSPYINVIGSATGPRSFLVNGERVAGAFSPRGETWNLQLEHSFQKLLRVRAVYTDNKSVGLIVLEREELGTSNEVVLNGDGNSRYRQAEITARLTWNADRQLVFSYTRSRAEGSLNSFDSFLGNFALPRIRPDVYSNLAGDLPNRFLVWGHLALPLWNLQVNPILEYRNGFPYATLDAYQNYVGTPYRDSTRFPGFFSADARLMRDFKVSPKYTLRLSLTGLNLTNHFNALAVHENISDPQYGVFFGNYHRRYRFDFEVIF